MDNLSKHFAEIQENTVNYGKPIPPPPIKFIRWTKGNIGFDSMLASLWECLHCPRLSVPRYHS